MTDDADRQAVEAGIQALRAERKMHACSDAHCRAEYVTEADASRCAASHQPPKELFWS